MFNLDDLISGNGFVRYIKALAHKTSPNAAILFGQLVSSKKYFEDRKMLTRFEEYANLDFFFVEQSYIFDETALSEYQQKKACDQLVNEGYLITLMKGLPRKKYYCITSKIYKDLIDKLQEKVRHDHNPRNLDYVTEETKIIESDKIGLYNQRNLDAINKNKTNKIKGNKKKEKDIISKLINVNNDEVNNLFVTYRSLGITKKVFLEKVKEVNRGIELGHVVRPIQYLTGILDNIVKYMNPIEGKEVNTDLPIYNWLE